MNIQAISALQMTTHDFTGPTVLIRMADSKEQLVEPKDKSKIITQLDLIFNDTNSDYSIVKAPTRDDAREILNFYVNNAVVRQTPNFTVQCQAGVGRSQAVVAAILKINGQNNWSIIQNGTYNRKLYNFILEEAKVPIDPEPLVSIVCRLKYHPERMEAFILSMQCQRYKNWELILIPDGQFDRGSKFKLWCPTTPEGLFQYLDDGRIRAIETNKPLGFWGHPYRQLGIDAANGEFIGLQNDDNYLTPGFMEQLVGNIIHYNADICACETVHSYSGWGVAPAGTDLGCFIARASLMKKVKWPGNHFTADKDYFRALCKETEAAKVLALKKPLFIHN